MSDSEVKEADLALGIDLPENVTVEKNKRGQAAKLPVHMTITVYLDGTFQGMYTDYHHFGKRSLSSNGFELSYFLPRIASELGVSVEYLNNGLFKVCLESICINFLSLIFL